MANLERIERLEKLYERLYHTYELLSIYVPKMCDFWEDYLRKSNQYRYDVSRDLNNLRDLVRITDKDMQEHFSAHSDKSRRHKDEI